LSTGRAWLGEHGRQCTKAPAFGKPRLCRRSWGVAFRDSASGNRKA